VFDVGPSKKHPSCVSRSEVSQSLEVTDRNKESILGSLFIQVRARMIVSSVSHLGSSYIVQEDAAYIRRRTKN